MTSEAERALGDAATIDLTTIGRRSGRPTRIEIWMFRVDGRFIITGTPGPRDWYANVLERPEVTVHVKNGHVADLPAVAAPVTDSAFRRRVFLAPHTSWYLSQTSLEDLVATSPMVAVEFTDIPPPS